MPIPWPLKRAPRVGFLRGPHSEHRVLVCSASLNLSFRRKSSACVMACGGWCEPAGSSTIKAPVVGREGIFVLLKTCYSLSICWLLACVLIGSFLQSVTEGLRTGTERECCLPDVAQQGTRDTGFKAFCSPGFCNWVAEVLLSGGGLAGVSRGR